MEQTFPFNEGKRPYHSRARQRQAEETRGRILAATRELFAARGYAGTTLEAIAEIAEVSPKTVAAVFGSKRAAGRADQPQRFQHSGKASPR